MNVQRKFKFDDKVFGKIISFVPHAEIGRIFDMSPIYRNVGRQKRINREILSLQHRNVRYRQHVKRRKIKHPIQMTEYLNKILFENYLQIFNKNLIELSSVQTDKVFIQLYLSREFLPFLGLNDAEHRDKFKFHFQNDEKCGNISHNWESFEEELHFKFDEFRSSIIRHHWFELISAYYLSGISVLSNFNLSNKIDRISFSVNSNLLSMVKGSVLTISDNKHAIRSFAIFNMYV